MHQSPIANPTIVPVASLLVLVVLLTVAVYTELKENRIPNWLTMTGMGLGLAISYLHGTNAIWSSLGGLTIGFGFLFVFYVFGGVGGGDVKLMGAAGALMGAGLIPAALFFTAMFGAFLAIMMVVWRKGFWVRICVGLRKLMFWRKVPEKQAEEVAPVIVPYGVAIAVGCLAALLTK